MTSTSNPAKRSIEQMAPWIGEEEEHAVAEYLRAGGWLTEFKKTLEFERMLAEYTGSRHAVALSSGTAALFAALMAVGIGPGDEVIVPDFTMIASANAVVLAGATPVMADISRVDLCLDLNQIEAHLTPRTKAILLVSLNGRAPDMDETLRIARKHSLRLVEDAAQSLGSLHKGKHLGTFGEVGIFSFSPLKIITTGQGGIAVTDDPHLAARIRRFKDFGRSSGGTDVHDTIGYNFKFTDMQAVIGIEQMKKLAWRVARKKEIFELYRAELTGLPGIHFIDTDLAQTTPWFIDVLAGRRDELRDYLAAHGIKSRPFYPPVHRQPAYSLPGSHPAAEFCSGNGLWLPSSTFLSDATIREICGFVRRFTRHEPAMTRPA
jgi:perosamine synthetase